MRAILVFSVGLGLCSTPALVDAQHVSRIQFEHYRHASSWSLSRVDSRTFKARGAEAYSRQVADTVTGDHRWEGVVLGGLLLGIGTAIVGNRLCNEDNIAEKKCFGPTVGYGLVGATVGVVTGGLIGSAIPKKGKE
jgi:hypothetical protein